MKRRVYIEGFVERLELACKTSGLSKSELARRAGIDRKQLCRKKSLYMMNSGDVAKFCVATHTDANWLLGITK